MRPTDRLVKPRRRGVRLAVLVTVLAAGASCGLRACHLFDKPAAHCSKRQGKVTVSEQQRAQDLAQGEKIYNDQVVTTGNDGRATLVFVGGQVIELQPNTSLVVRRGGGATAQFGAVLISGAMRVDGRGATVAFDVGTPFGLVMLDVGGAQIEVNSATGISVLVGAISLVGETGSSTTINAGQTMSIDGVVIDLRKKQEEAVTLEPMTFLLLSSSKQVRVRRAGEQEWKRPDKRETLATGDAVRTGRGTGTQVRFDERAELSLGPQTEVTFGDGLKGTDKQQAKYAIAGGDATLVMTKEGEQDIAHEVAVVGQPVRIAPGAQRADVHVQSVQGGKANLEVRLGQVVLADGTVIGAGNKVELASDATHGAVQPLAQTSLELAVGSSASIYYSGGSLPPVAFSWKPETEQATQRFELARDNGFQKIVLAEQVSGGRFVYDRLASGRFYWRVQNKEGWQRGTYSVDRKEASGDCPNCKRTNTIDDTGEQTVVYFQKRLPAIALRWAAEKGAKSYRLKVFADGALDTPMVDETVSDLKFSFEGGRFGEGRYFWLVAATDAGGKTLRQGRMNTLEIAYDNAVVDLAIRSPQANERVSGASLVVRGEVALGTKLRVNAKKVDIDRQGRFRERVPLSKGRNDIIFHTLAGDGVERFYVHPVVRR